MAYTDEWVYSSFLAKHILIGSPEWQLHCTMRAAAMTPNPPDLSSYATLVAEADRAGLSPQQLATKRAADAVCTAGVASFYRSLTPPDTLSIATPCEIKADLRDGSFSGYLAVFNNIDSYSDRIRPGAFTKSILAARHSGRRQLLPLLWQHQQDRPCGIVDDLYEDPTGLHIHAKLTLGMPDGQLAYQAVKTGTVDGLSIGYRTLKDEWKREGGRDIRDLLEIQLLEGSLVTLPANNAARITVVN